MRPRPELVARIGGLRTRLLRRKDFDALLAAGDLPALVRALVPGVLTEALPAGIGPAELDAALAGRSRRAWEVLGRWFGDAPGRALLFGEQDLQGLRLLFRASAAGRSGRGLLPFLMPTPELPAGIAEELTRQGSPRELARILKRRGHPLAAAVQGPASAARPDLSRLEAAMARAWLEEAIRDARGDEEAEADAREQVDLANLRTLRTLAGRSREGREDSLFLEGSERLPPRLLRATLDRLSTAGTRPEALAALSRPLRGTAAGASLLAWESDGASWERALLDERLRRARQRAAASPSGWAPVAAFALRLRVEAADLRNVLWGIALARPSPRVAATLGSPS